MTIFRHQLILQFTEGFQWFIFKEYLNPMGVQHFPGEGVV